MSAAVLLIVAQRLTRKICAECKEATEANPQGLIDIGVKPEDAAAFTLYKGAGCRVCGNKGYKGRVALYEVMTMSDEIKEFVLNGASAAELKAEAIRQGMRTLRMSGVHKIKEGVTTIEEVCRTTTAD